MNSPKSQVTGCHALIYIFSLTKKFILVCYYSETIEMKTFNGDIMKKEMSRLEIIRVLEKYEKKYNGCMDNLAYYDRLEDKPFAYRDVFWAVQNWDEFECVMNMVCSMCSEWKVPGKLRRNGCPDLILLNDFMKKHKLRRNGCPDLVALNDFIKKYNLPRNVGKVLVQLVKRVNVLAEERRVLCRDSNYR